MEDYKTMYLHLFNRVSDAVNALEAMNYGQAKELLSHTGLSVSAVSLRVGFKEAKYFSRVFASMTGEKPSEYRERMRREEEKREESAH